MLQVGDKVRIVNNKSLNSDEWVYHHFRKNTLCIIINTGSFKNSFILKSFYNEYITCQNVYIWDFIKVD